MKRHVFLAGTFAAATLPSTARASVLESRLERLASASSGVVGIYARKMDRSDPVIFNANVIFPSASVIKLAIFVSLFQYAETVPGVFEQTITLKLNDFVGGSEILDGYNPGSTITIDRLAHAMIQQSDNTASNVLIDFLGFQRIMHTVHRAGLHHTQLKRHFMDPTAIAHHSENLTTAHDMGLLLFQIERGAHEALRTVASPKSCRRMIDILLRQEDHDKIARGLPKGTPLANKTGEIDGVRNDIGIVDPYGDSPYVLAVLTKDLADFSLGNAAIRRIARAVHGALY
ncbi:MAG: serine hydrolase [Vulcanimicrobiaceae bacterium]